jgi:dTDP-4-dehydrorhamnose 3,5-epimerase-like enzyme
MENNVQIIDFGCIGTPEIGYISVAECQKGIPFDIKRVFWSYYTPHHVIRGKHAHHQLNQVLIAVAGIITIHTEDRQGNLNSFVLDSPGKGLFVPGRYWHTMKFSHNAVLLSLSSMEYNNEDYIRDYLEFKEGND